MSEEPVKTRIFLSYSRKDGEFTRRLAAAALEARGYTPDYDRSLADPANIATGIAAGDEWWQRLQDMIAAADVMVFIVSPDSAASKVCDEEIAYARGVGKRLVPILWRPLDFAKAPPRLSALNVKIDFTGDSGEAFAAALDQLCATLDLNVAWHRENRRLTELALKWDAGARPADSLMRPADIRAAERLLERRPRSAEPPPTILLDYLAASRSHLEEEIRKLRRITGRAFVSPALQALQDNSNEHALRLAVAGALLADDLGLELVPELWSPLARAMFKCRTEIVLKGHVKPVTDASQAVLRGPWDTHSGMQADRLRLCPCNGQCTILTTEVTTQSRFLRGASSFTRAAKSGAAGQTKRRPALWWRASGRARW